jgi:hypothetical protein
LPSLSNNPVRFHGLRLALLVLAAVSGAGAEVLDVSGQWKAHASSSPASVPVSTAAAPAQSSSSPPADCGCADMTVPERLSDATVAFTGQVFDVRSPKKGRRSMFFDVDEIFKGSPKPETEIVSEVSGDACDLTFEEGKMYLVYARWEWGQMVTSRCMGTKSIHQAKSDATALGPSESLKEKLYDHLRNACMGRVDTLCCLASLKAIRQDYSLPEPEGGCPSGMIPDRLRCAGSYTWCIPTTEKSHR